MFISSRRIYTEHGIIDGVLEVRGREFGEIIHRANFQGKVDMVLDDKILIPGLIDIHLHGFGGFIDYNKPFTTQALEGFLSVLALNGTTSCSPSLQEDMYPLIKTYQQSPQIAKLLGLTLEGRFSIECYPFFREQFKEVKELSVDYLKELNEACGNKLRYVMIAPELPEAKKVMHYLKTNGIKVSVGHTLMSAEDFKDFNQENLVDALTHTSNNMGQMHQRNVGVMGVGLLDPNIYAEIITDFIHVSKEMLSIILKVKGYEKTILVSDSIYLGGSKPGKYYFQDLEMTVTEDHKIMDLQGSIQGCYYSLFPNMRKLIQNGLATLEEAIVMGALNPAKLLGIDAKTGSITLGKDADFLILDGELNLEQTYIDGKPVKMNECLGKE
jgi:N-acetylglucosamine-6-phosphate deacetylase